MNKYIVLLYLLITTTIAFADIYKWTDEQGTIHFSDTPVNLPNNSENIQENKKPQDPEPYVSKIPIRPPSYYYNQNQKPAYPMPMTKGLEEARKIINQQAEQTIKKTANVLGTILLIILSFVIIWIITVLDILKSQFHRNDKLVWFLAVTMIPYGGVLAYALYGRKQKIKDNDIDY